MKKISLFRRTACAVALSACMATPVLAKDSGFYLGADIGQSKFDVDQADFRFFPISTGVQLDDTDLAYSLSFGYRAMPYLAIELGLSDLGEVDVVEQGFTTLSPTPLGGFGRANLESRGATLALIGTLPLGNFELYGKVGAMYAESQVSLIVTQTFGGTGAALLTAEDETTEAVYGVGAGYVFNEEVFLNIEWTRIPKLGDEDEFGIEPDVDLISLGVQYRF